MYADAGDWRPTGRGETLVFNVSVDVVEDGTRLLVIAFVTGGGVVDEFDGCDGGGGGGGGFMLVLAPIDMIELVGR